MNPSLFFNSGDSQGQNLCGFNSFREVYHRDYVRCLGRKESLPTAKELRDKIPSLAVEYAAVLQTTWDASAISTELASNAQNGMLTDFSLFLLTWHYNAPVLVVTPPTGGAGPTAYVSPGKDLKNPYLRRSAILFDSGHCHWGRDVFLLDLQVVANPLGVFAPSKADYQHAFVALWCHQHRGTLLVKNRKTTRWMLPGGNIDVSDVTPEDAAIRELQEEAGYGLDGTRRNCQSIWISANKLAVCFHYFELNSGMTNRLFQSRSTPGETVAWTFSKWKNDVAVSNQGANIGLRRGTYEFLVKATPKPVVLPATPAQQPASTPTAGGAATPSQDQTVPAVESPKTTPPPDNVAVQPEALASDSSDDEDCTVTIGPIISPLVITRSSPAPVSPPSASESAVDDEECVPVETEEEPEPEVLQFLQGGDNLVRDDGDEAKDEGSAGNTYRVVQHFEDYVLLHADSTETASVREMMDLKLRSLMEQADSALHSKLTSQTFDIAFGALTDTIVQLDYNVFEATSIIAEWWHYIVTGSTLHRPIKQFETTVIAIYKSRLFAEWDTNRRCEVMAWFPDFGGFENDFVDAVVPDPEPPSVATQTVAPVHVPVPSDKALIPCGEVRNTEERFDYRAFHESANLEDLYKREWKQKFTQRRPAFVEILEHAGENTEVQSTETISEWLQRSKVAVHAHLYDMLKNHMMAAVGTMGITQSVLFDSLAVLTPLVTIIIELIDGRWTWYSLLLQVTALGTAIYGMVAKTMTAIASLDTAINLARIAVEHALGIRWETEDEGELRQKMISKSSATMHGAIPSLALASVLTTVGMCGFKGDVSAANAGLNLAKNCTDMGERFVTAVAYYFGWDLDGKLALSKTALAYGERLDEIAVETPESIIEHFQEYTALSGEIKHFITTTKGLVDSATMGIVTAKLAQLDSRLQISRRTWNQRNVRPAPVGVYLYSRQGGLGKTDFVSYAAKALGRKIAGFNTNVMGMSSGQYAPAYNGEHTLFYDEVGGSVDPKCNPFEQLNNILSGNTIAQPGANLESKEQILRPHVVFLASNVPLNEQQTQLKADPDRAMKSRLIQFEVRDPQFQAALGRYMQPHRQPDYSHLQFVDDQGKLHTAEQLLDRICECLARNIENYNSQRDADFSAVKPYMTNGTQLNLNTITAKSAADTKFCLTIVGKPGRGKSTKIVPSFIRKTHGPETTVLAPKDFAALKELDLTNPPQQTIVILDDVLDLTLREHQNGFLNCYNDAASNVSFVVVTNAGPPRPTGLRHSAAKLYHCVTNPSEGWRSIGGDLDYHETKLRDGLDRRLGFTANSYSQALVLDQNSNAYDFITGRLTTIEDAVEKYYNHRLGRANGIRLETLPDPIPFAKIESDVWFETDEILTASSFFVALFAKGRISARAAPIGATLSRMSFDDMGFTEAVELVVRELLSNNKTLRIYISVCDKVWYVNNEEFYVGSSDDPFALEKDSQGAWYIHERTAPGIEVKMAVDQELMDAIRNNTAFTPALVARPDFKPSVWGRLGRAKRNEDVLWRQLDQTFPMSWRQVLNNFMARIKSKLVETSDWLQKHPILGAMCLLATTVATYVTGKVVWNLVKKIFPGLQSDERYVTSERCELCVGGYQSPVCEFSNFTSKARGTKRKVKSFTVGGRKMLVSGDESIDQEMSDQIHDAERAMKATGYSRVANGPFNGRQATFFREIDEDGCTHYVVEYDDILSKSGNLIDQVVPLINTGSGDVLWGLMVTDTICRFPRHLITNHRAVVMIRDTDITVRIVQEFKNHEAAYGVLERYGKVHHYPNMKDISSKFLAHAALLHVKDAVMARPPPHRTIAPVKVAFVGHRTMPLYDDTTGCNITDNILYAARTVVSTPYYKKGDCGALLLAKSGNTNVILGQLVGSSNDPSVDRDIFSGITVEEWNEFVRNYQSSMTSKSGNAQYVTVDWMRQDEKGPVKVPAKLLDKVTLPVESDWCDSTTGFDLVCGFANRLPYDQASASKPIYNLAMEDVLGNLKRPVPPVAVIESKYAEQIPKDDNGNVFAPAVRLSKCKPRYVNPAVEHAEQLSLIGSELGEHYRMLTGHPNVQPLSQSDAIWGCHGIPPMARDTSTGAVYQTMYPGLALKSQLWTVNRDEFTGKGDFVSLLASQWDSWKTETPIIYPQAVSMKAENLLVEKLHKKRLVFVCDPMTSVNQRRAFYPIQFAFAKLGFESPFLLAYDPILETDQFVRKLQNRMQWFASFDVSAFDLTVPEQVVEAALNFCVSVSKAGEVYTRILRSAFMAASGAPALIRQGLYTRHGGIASGITCTSLIDGICMLNISAYCWHRANDIWCDVPLYVQNNKSRHTGDDTTLANSGKHFVSASSYTAVCASDLGMQLTACANKNTEGEFSRRVYDINHCSRQVVDVPGFPGVLSGKLKPEAVSGALCWSRTRDEREINVQLEMCQKELCLYDDATYEKFQRVVVHHGLKVELVPLEEYRSHVKEGILNAPFTNSRKISDDPIRLSVIPVVKALKLESKPKTTTYSFSKITQDSFEEPDVLLAKIVGMAGTSHTEKITWQDGTERIMHVHVPTSQEFMREFLHSVEARTVPGWVSELSATPEFTPHTKKQRHFMRWVALAHRYKNILASGSRYWRILNAVDEFRQDCQAMVSKSESGVATAGAPVAVAPPAASASTPNGQPVGAMDDVLANQAVANVDPMHVTAGTAVAPVVMTQTGGVKGMLLGQTDVSKNLLTVAGTKIFDSIFVINMGVEEGVVVKQFNVNPWNSELLNKATRVWAGLHERFIPGPNGAFEIHIQVVSAATVIGNLKVAYIPATYDKMPLNQANLDAFNPLEFACNTSGEGMIPVTPTAKEYALTAICRDSAQKAFGRLVFMTATKFENSFTASIGVQVKVALSLAPGSAYMTPAILTNPSASAELGFPFDIPTYGNDVAIDGRHMDPVLGPATTTNDMAYAGKSADGRVTLAGIPIVRRADPIEDKVFFATGTGTLRLGINVADEVPALYLTVRDEPFFRVIVDNVTKKDKSSLKVFTGNDHTEAEFKRLTSDSAIHIKGLKAEQPIAKNWLNVGTALAKDPGTGKGQDIVVDDVELYQTDADRVFTFNKGPPKPNSSELMVFTMNADLSHVTAGDPVGLLADGTANFGNRLVGAPFCAQAPTNTPMTPVGTLAVRLAPKYGVLPGVPKTAGEGRSVAISEAQLKLREMDAHWLKLNPQYSGILTTFTSKAGSILGQVYRDGKNMYCSAAGVQIFGYLDIADAIQSHEAVSTFPQMVTVAGSFKTRVITDRLYDGALHGQRTYSRMSTRQLLGEKITSKSWQALNGAAHSYMTHVAPAGGPTIVVGAGSSNKKSESSKAGGWSSPAEKIRSALAPPTRTIGAQTNDVGSRSIGIQNSAGPPDFSTAAGRRRAIGFAQADREVTVLPSSNVLGDPFETGVKELLEPSGELNFGQTSADWATDTSELVEDSMMGLSGSGLHDVSDDSETEATSWTYEDFSSWDESALHARCEGCVEPPTSGGSDEIISKGSMVSALGSSGITAGTSAANTAATNKNNMNMLVKQLAAQSALAKQTAQLQQADRVLAVVPGLGNQR